MPTRRTFLTVPLTLAAQSILDLPPAPAGERIAYSADQFQFGELRVPSGAGPHPVAIVIHGGYWRSAYDLAHLGHFCEALKREGIATWSVEYRRLGNRGGGFPGTFDDVASGAAHLKKIPAARHLDLDRVVATGHSAGGQLVLWLAKQRVIELKRVIPLAPVADLRRAFELHLSDTVVADLLGGSPAKVPERYRSASPIELVPLGVEQRVIHGLNDNVVPISLSRDYVAAARSHGDDSTLTEVPGAGHFELIDPRSSAWDVVKKAVARG
jgi:acetyl esterase/lipase